MSFGVRPGGGLLPRFPGMIEFLRLVTLRRSKMKITYF